MKLECCFFYSSYLKVSICALRRSTISKGWSWYILKLVSRNRGPKASMLWQSLNLRNLARTGRGLPSFLSFLLLSFLPFLPSSFLPSFPSFFFISFLPSFLSFLLLSFLPFLPSSFQGGGLVGFRLPRQHQHPQDPFRGRNVALIRLFSAPVVGMFRISNFHA